MTDIATSGQVAAPKQRRGFALMTPAERSDIARMGGQTAHAIGRAHKWTSEEARAAGKKGGAKVAQDREHMRRIGRKGGFEVSRDSSRMRAMGRKGGAAVSADRAHMREIGKLGGKARKRRT